MLLGGSVNASSLVNAPAERREVLTRRYSVVESAAILLKSSPMAYSEAPTVKRSAKPCVAAGHNRLQRRDRGGQPACEMHSATAPSMIPSAQMAAQGLTARGNR